MEFGAVQCGGAGAVSYRPGNRSLILRGFAAVVSSIAVDGFKASLAKLPAFSTQAEGLMSFGSYLEETPPGVCWLDRSRTCSLRAKMPQGFSGPFNRLFGLAGGIWSEQSFLDAGLPLPRP